MAKKILLLFVCLYMALPGILMAQADDPQKKYTAFDMRHNGKIYVVVAVCLTILIGLFIYVFMVDRRVRRMEKEGNG